MRRGGDDDARARLRQLMRKPQQKRRLAAAANQRGDAARNVKRRDNARFIFVKNRMHAFVLPE